MFKIPETKLSPSGWRSVSTILNEGVGMSTLPCAKLRAILNAAKEIIRVYSEEHKFSEEKGTLEEQAADDENENDVLRKSALGADDFLPIFIYSVVRAEMERPCALCKYLNASKEEAFSITVLTIFLGVLLQTLCDKTSRIGETGYYLASFEGAIAHIQELDLTQDKELRF
jgi:hypothetical protein